MASTERIFIAVDGSNFYHRLKEIPELKGKLLSFDYRLFATWLVGERHLSQSKYYIGVIRAHPGDAKGQQMRRDQQRLFSRLRKAGWNTEFGYILDVDGKRHEKGVDVHIATDILIGAYEDIYDTLILVSSDTDLIPALAKTREKGKKVEYVGFSHKPSYGLIAHSDIRRLLRMEDLEQFLI